MRITAIVNDSPAEVEGHFSDVIYFQGCSKNCGYCFNPELQDPDEGLEVDYDYIQSHLSELSDVVVLTGGEPLDQKGTLALICALKVEGKKVVLETSVVGTEWSYADKVLYSIKTFDPPSVSVLFGLHQYTNVIPVVVLGHEWFKKKTFAAIVRIMEGDLWFRYYNDTHCDLTDVYRIIKREGKKIRELKKINVD